MSARAWTTAKAIDVLSDMKRGDWGLSERQAGAVAVRVIRGTDFPQAAANHLSGAPIRNLTMGRYESRRLRCGDLLIEMSGGSEKQATGRALLVTESLLASADYPVGYSNFVMRIRPPDTVDPEFVWLQWQYLYHRGRTRIYERRTTGIRNFKLDAFLDNEELVIPPLPEQRAIAHALRAVQRAREQTEQAVEAARQLKRSLTRHLLTHGTLAPASDTETQSAGLGEMPATWVARPLGEVATLQRGCDLPAAQRDTGPYPVLGSNGRVGSHATAIARGPGVLVGRTGSVGNVVWADSDYWPLNTTLWVKDFHGNDPRFVYYLLSAFDFRSYASRVSVPALNRNLVHPVTVGVPPLTQQRHIAAILDASGAKISAEVGRRDALDALFRSLLNALMTGRLRVNVARG